jgi:hypothetical protein
MPITKVGLPATGMEKPLCRLADLPITSPTAQTARAAVATTALALSTTLAATALCAAALTMHIRQS